MKATSWYAGLVLLGSPVAAQQPLTIADAVARAERVHPAVAAAVAGQARAASGRAEAEASRLPVLSLDANATQHAEPMVVAPLHGFDPLDPPEFERTLFQAGLNLGYTLFDGGARGARIGRAERLATAAGAVARATRQALAAQVASAYLRVLARREQLDAQRARLSAVTGERARAALLFAEGRAARLVSLRAEAAVSAAAADTVDGAGQLDVAERVLARLLALEADTLRALALAPVRAASPAAVVAPPGGERPNDVVLEVALGHNPEVARARAQLDAARRGVGEARALWLPRLQLGARYVEYASSAGREAGEWQTGIQVGYPLFTGGARTAARDRAEAEVAAAGAELRSVELRVADAVDGALSAWASAAARATALEGALAQATEVVRIEKLALDEGAGVQTDYLAAEAELLRMRSALTDARYAVLLARVELARVTGELGSDWLRTNLESGR